MFDASISLFKFHPSHRTDKVSTYTPLDADALVLVTLCCDHDVCLVQYKHVNFLRVDESELLTPVQDRTRGTDHNLLLELHPSLHCTKRNSPYEHVLDTSLTFLYTDSIHHIQSFSSLLSIDLLFHILFHMLLKDTLKYIVADRCIA